MQKVYLLRLIASLGWLEHSSEKTIIIHESPCFRYSIVAFLVRIDLELWWGNVLHGQKNLARSTYSTNMLPNKNLKKLRGLKKVVNLWLWLNGLFSQIVGTVHKVLCSEIFHRYIQKKEHRMLK